MLLSLPDKIALLLLMFAVGTGYARYDIGHWPNIRHPSEILAAVVVGFFACLVFAFCCAMVVVVISVPLALVGLAISKWRVTAAVAAIAVAYLALRLRPAVTD